MACSSPVDTPATSRIIQVSGITYRLLERLEYPLLIQLWVDASNIVSLLLKRDGEQGGIRLFQTPRKLSTESVLTVQIQEKHRDGSHKILARLSLASEHLSLASDYQNGMHRIKIDDPKIQIWLNLDAVPSAPRSDPIDLYQTSQPHENHLQPPGQVTDLLKSASNSATQSLRTLRTTLDRISGLNDPAETSLKFTTTVSELNALAKAVSGCVTVVCEQTGAPSSVNKDILELTEIMARTVNRVRFVQDIAELNVLRKSLEKFPGLMLETVDLMEMWVKQNVIDSSALSLLNKDKINELKQRHNSFEDEFDKGFRIDSMNSRNKSEDWRELKELLLAGIKMVDPRAMECMPGTRSTILAEVDAKVDDPDDTNIIWIRGSPGSGKSSISLTLKSRLRGQGRLITYFRFDRSEASTTTPTALWRFVAYDLARRFPSVRTRLLQLLRNDTVDFDSPMDVFTSLVEDTLLKFTSNVDRPLVIIIDALDECGGLAGHQSPDRQMLLQSIRRWSRLPKHFKLLVTSRDEGDVSRVLPSITLSIQIPSGDSLTQNSRTEASIHANNDIRMFLESRFQRLRERLPSLPRDWPGSVTVDEMVLRAAGIFLWATAAANFIDGRGINPQDRVKRIINHAPESRGMQPLYSLYTTILNAAFGEIDDDDSDAEVLQSVFGTMVLARRPLHDIEYTRVLSSKSVTEAMMESIRDGLHSVLSPGTNFRFTHKSFDDFLLSKDCPSKYRIRTEESQYTLSNFCLSTMTGELCFNICKLETSCLRNVNIPNIETKVTNNIPPLLSYSCCFLADHLGLTVFDEFLMGKVKELIGDKLLYWFEAMSLLGEMNRVCESLLLILKWSHLSPDDEFKDFIHDARRFIGAFGYPIAQSAPHIYISALPFAPLYSSVANRFLPRFPQTLALSAGKPTNWSPCIYTSEHHKGPVRSVAFSSDEKHFVSGSSDKTICVHDSDTGNLVSGSFSGNQSVYNAFFDPDNRRVWASYIGGKVICWDIETGENHLAFHTSEPVACCGFNARQKIISAGEIGIGLWSTKTGSCELRREYSYEVTRVSISPNGCYIALVERDDGSVRIWKVVNGSEIQTPSHSHPQFRHAKPVSALSFSEDSNFTVSGSRDGTIAVWDAKSGNTVGRLLDTVAEVDAVAYSPRHHLIVSSSGGTGAVMVWDALTCEAILGPLEGHTSLVTKVILSNNGRRGLTASWDGTVRMWDLDRKRVASTARGIASVGHTSQVQCITFSPCGEKFVSLDRGVIRIWDLYSRRCLVKCNLEKASDYNRIIFSPDGSKLVAYCTSGSTLGGWNAVTGEPTSHHDLRDDNYKSTYISHVSFRSTDQRLVTCSSNGIVRIWNNDMTEAVDTSSPQPDDPNTPVTVIALSPDGLTIIVNDYKRNPNHYMWSTMTYQPLPLTFVDDEQFSGYPGAYSPNGQLFASVHISYEGVRTLGVWDARTGELVARSSALDDRIYGLAFSPDDRHIAVSYSTSVSKDFSIWIYDARTGLLASGPWSGHSDVILSLSFSPDGRKLLSGSRDRQIRIWNVTDLIGDSRTTPGFLGVGIQIDDGWVKDAEGKLMFWVPKDHRASLVWPQSELLDDNGVTTELDLSGFTYGDYWIECFKGGE